MRNDPRPRLSSRSGSCTCFWDHAVGRRPQTGASCNRGTGRKKGRTFRGNGIPTPLHRHHEGLRPSPTQGLDRRCKRRVDAVASRRTRDVRMPHRIQETCMQNGRALSGSPDSCQAGAVQRVGAITSATSCEDKTAHRGPQGQLWHIRPARTGRKPLGKFRSSIPSK